MQITRRGIGGALILIVLLYVVFLSSHPTAIRHEGIVFTRPEPYYGGTNLYYYDLVTGRERKITTIYRSFGILPVRNPYGSSVFVDNLHLLTDDTTIMFTGAVTDRDQLYELNRMTLRYRAVGDYPTLSINASTLLAPDGQHYVTLIDGVAGSSPSATRDQRLDVFTQRGEYVTTIYRQQDHTITDVVWAPDSRHLVYTVLTDGRTTVYRSRLDGTSVQIPLPLVGIGSISWSPTQTHLALTGARTTTTPYAVFTVDVNGAHLQQVTRRGEQSSSNEGGDGNMRWSPDGTRLLFTRTSAGTRDLYVSNVDGSGLERVAPDVYGTRPLWIPALP